MPIKLMQRFLQLESAGGILLFVAAILAMLWANSSLAPLHQRFIDAFLFTINDGMMAIFFLFVGLELKRGYLEGEFSHLSQILLPAFAALGGMIIPALIYIVINFATPDTLKGWSTPVATDIAFALGVLSLFGKRIPVPLKLFLLALAIFDDIGAILIIGCFYTTHLSLGWLAGSCISILALWLLNLCAIRLLVPYLLLGAALWFTMLNSGIHPTLAGVILALTIPGQSNGPSSVHKLESILHPWVVYGILPLFALANAGFSWQNLTLSSLAQPVVLGIALGLFVGKQLGVLGYSWLLIRWGKAALPEKTSWLALYGVALLCGIGFTMSLFLGTLSFQNENIYLVEVRLGVIIGSFLSALTGALVLLFAYRQKAITQKGSKHVD